MVTFEGEPGTGKSRLCEVLGGEWFTDAPVDPHEKDSASTIQAKWFVEMAELEVTRRADVNALKAFLSRRVDRVRPAYGRHTVDMPRQCVFMGTFNPEGDGTYLRDSTGNRRFWVVATKKIDVEGVAKVRDQLFAEAVAAVNGGEELYLQPEVETLSLHESEMRYAVDAWTEAVLRWLSNKDNCQETFFSTRDVYIGAIGGSDKSLGRSEQMRVGVIMHRAGWTKSGGTTKDGIRARGFKRPV
jgi:putative DNA primase/helicase